MARLRFWRRHRRDGGGALPVGSIVPGSLAAERPSAHLVSPGEDPLAWQVPPRAGVAEAVPTAAVWEAPLAEVAEPPEVPEVPKAAVPSQDKPAEAQAPAGPRVGLVFGDGTHVVLDPDDPRAVRFAALAEELNR